MNKKEIINYVRDLAEKSVLDTNIKIFDVDYVKESGIFYLRIFIEKQGGVNLDDCSLISNKISEELDINDPIEDAYYLEVSSPGIDRPFKTNEDFLNNINKEVEVKLYSKINEKKFFVGTLLEFNDEFISIIENNEIIKIERNKIIKINKSVEF